LYKSFFYKEYNKSSIKKKKENIFFWVHRLERTFLFSLLKRNGTSLADALKSIL